MGMNTLGSMTAAPKVVIKESYAIKLGFDGPDSATVANRLYEGQPVKMTNTGVIAACGAGTDVMIGIVDIGVKQPYDEPNNYTILTVFNADVTGIADGTVTPGDLVISTGKDATTGAPKFKTAAAGEYAVGIAIGGAASATTTPVRVGTLRSPLLKLPA